MAMSACILEDGKAGLHVCSDFSAGHHQDRQSTAEVAAARAGRLRQTIISSDLKSLCRSCMLVGWFDEGDGSLSKRDFRGF
jgi:hypothetical protein